MIHKLLELETVVLEGGSGLLKDLAALGRQPAPDPNAFSRRLRELVGHMERLAAAIEKTLPDLAREDAELALGAVERVLHTWADITTSIGRVDALAARARLDEGFESLGSLAAEHNPIERFGLGELAERLRALAPRPTPPPPEPEAPFAESPAPAPEVVKGPPRVPAAATPTLLAPPPEIRSPRLDYSFWPAENEPGPVEDRQFADCLGAAGASDPLDTHTALTDLLTRYRSRLLVVLVQSATGPDPGLERVFRNLWEQPELLLLSEHFLPAGATRLLPLLAQAAAYPQAARFGKLLALFRIPTERDGASPEARIAVGEPQEADRERLLRALLVHPLSSHRRYATSELGPAELWPLLACPVIPPAPLVEVADRLALDDVSSDHQKVFLDCVLKSLAAARSEPEIRAAGYVLERAARFEFAVEDGYYRKLTQLAETLTRAEGALGVESAYARQAVALLKRRKDLAGAQPTRQPASFAGVPPTAQRKLARQGLYVNLFVRHPDPRIAMETLRFIDNPVKAEAVAKLPTANRLVIAEIGRRDELLKTYGARLALLAHPRASLEAAQKYASLLKPEDLEQLTRRKSINPEIAVYLREQLTRERPRTEH